MDTLLATSAVVCDDDAVLRTVVGQLLAESGYTVAGQADGAESALYEIEQTDATVLILDLSLAAGRGEDLLRVLGERHPEVKVVVFSAFVDDATRLLAEGATAVVEKPDFVRLEEIVRQLRTTALSLAELRRPLPRPLPQLEPPRALTVSGLEPWTSFRSMLDELERGDALLVFDVAPSPSLAPVWDDVFRVDYRLALARAAVETRRSHDRVSISPEGLPTMALVAGHPEAPLTVFSRIETTWSREFGTGVPLCAFAHVQQSRPAHDILADGIALLRSDADPECPLRPI